MEYHYTLALAHQYLSYLSLPSGDGGQTGLWRIQWQIWQCTYSGAQLQVLGTVDVQVCQASAKLVNRSLAVVGSDGPSLLGRNWIKSLQLDWARICWLDVKLSEAVLSDIPKCFKKNWAYCRDTRLPFMWIPLQAHDSLDHVLYHIRCDLW